MVRLYLEGRGADLLHEEGLRVVVGPHPPLFHHHHPLRAEVLLPEDEVLHPVRFEIEAHLDPVGAQVLEIGRVIVGGEGVVVAAVLLDDPRKILGTDLGSPFEHHVLEHVGQAGLTPGFVPGPHPVPYLEGDNRRLVVLEEENLEAVGKGRLDDLIPHSRSAFREDEKDRKTEEHPRDHRAPFRLIPHVPSPLGPPLRGRDQDLPLPPALPIFMLQLFSKNGGL